MNYVLHLKYTCLFFIGLVVSLFQNLLNFNNNSYKWKLRGYCSKCNPNLLLSLFMLYSAYILNLICKDNKKILPGC